MRKSPLQVRTITRAYAKGKSPKKGTLRREALDFS
jgi:hypothetical protein